MGYLYRPMLKGKEDDYEPTPEDLALSRGAPGKTSDDDRCRHPDHGKADFCRGCLARFGKIWWVKYYVNGKSIRESTETEKETEARRFLKDREGSAAKGQPVLPQVERILHEEAAEDLRTHYKTTGERDLTEAGWRLTGTFSGALPEMQRGSLSEPPVFLGGADGTRTRDLRRDRPAF
jgi:hypothetical protein